MISFHFAMAIASVLIALDYNDKRGGFALLMRIVAGISFGTNIVTAIDLVLHG